MLDRLPTVVVRDYLFPYLHGVDKYALKLTAKQLQEWVGSERLPLVGLVNRPLFMYWLYLEFLRQAGDEYVFARAIGYSGCPEIISWYINSGAFTYETSTELCEMVCYKGCMCAIQLVRGTCKRNWGLGARAAAIRDRADVLEFLWRTGELPSSDDEFNMSAIVALRAGYHGSMKVIRWGIRAEQELEQGGDYLTRALPTTFIAMGACLAGRLEVIQYLDEIEYLDYLNHSMMIQSAMMGCSIPILEHLMRPEKVWPPWPDMTDPLGCVLRGWIGRELKMRRPNPLRVAATMEWWKDRGYQLGIGVETRVGLMVADPRRNHPGFCLAQSRFIQF